MKNIEKIVITGLVFVLIIGIVKYFVFRKKKTQITDINNVGQNDNSPFSITSNDDLDIANFVNTPLGNQIEPNISQDTKIQGGDSNFQSSGKKNIKDDIFSSESEDDKDFNDFVLQYDDFLSKVERHNVLSFQYRSTKEFKRNIDRTPEKINLKKFVTKVFSQNEHELTFFDRIFEEIRSGLEGGKICPGIKNIFKEYSDRNDNIMANICRKIRLNFSSRFETEELIDLINEKEKIFSFLRMDENVKNLISYFVQIPFIKTKDQFLFEPFVDILFDITDDIFKILGFRDIFYILVMKSFKKIKYCTDPCDIAGIKENFIFYFNRALFDCYSRLIKHLEFFDESTAQKNYIFENEFDFCGLFFHSNEETIKSGKNENFPTLLDFSIKRYFIIICYMMFSCSYYKKIGHKNNSASVFSWFNDQGELFNGKEFKKPNLEDFIAYYDQVFFVIFMGLRLFFYIVDPENTINDEYIRKLKEEIFEISYFLDNNPITRKLFTAFFDLE